MPYNSSLDSPMGPDMCSNEIIEYFQPLSFQFSKKKKNVFRFSEGLAKLYRLF